MWIISTCNLKSLHLPGSQQCSHLWLISGLDPIISFNISSDVTAWNQIHFVPRKSVTMTTATTTHTFNMTFTCDAGHLLIISNMPWGTESHTYMPCVPRPVQSLIMHLLTMSPDCFNHEGRRCDVREKPGVQERKSESHLAPHQTAKKDEGRWGTNLW